MISKRKGFTKFFFSVFISTFILFSCSKEDNKEATNETVETKVVNSDSDEEKAKRGKAVYFSNCISCHNTNPTLDGSVGPAIKGSGFELLKARIQNLSYPEGYKPKRDTKIMPKLPLSEDNISDIAAFLK